MAKRLHDTNIWKKKWFRDLSPAEKCIWFYLKDQCDISGVYEEDLSLAEFLIGCKIDSLNVFDRHIKRLSETKIWLVDFIEFQYGLPLNINSPVHKKVIYLLKKHKISDTLLDTLCNRVSNRVKEEDKDKDKEKDKEKEEDKKGSPRGNNRFIKPTIEMVRDYCQERGKGVDPEEWFDHYESNGWKVGKNPMKDWEAAVRTWERSEFKNQKPNRVYF